MNNKKGNQNARKYPDEWIDTFLHEYDKGKSVQKIAEDSTIGIATLESWKRQYITCVKSHHKRELKKDFIEQFIETGGNKSETARRIGVSRATVIKLRKIYLPEIDIKAQFTKLEVIGMFSDNEIAFYLHITPSAVRKLRYHRDRIIKILSPQPHDVE
jgi:transposase-like protein